MLIHGKSVRMSDRVRIYGRDGIGLCDLRVTVERSAFINDEGEAQFDLVYNDPNCREDFINHGNWLLVENDKLESWVGMIENLDWRRRYVQVNAFTPDRQLLYRDVPKQLQLSGKSGRIFQEIINIMNRAEATIIEAGDIWFGGKDMPLENLSGASLRDYIIDLAERSGAEYYFTAEPYQGKLKIKANWLDKVGVESNFPLEESYNLADEAYSLRQKAPRATELWGYGNGAGQTDRPTSTYTDLPSTAKYGLRQGTRYYSDYASAGAVLQALKSEINTTKDPRNTFKLSMVDVGDTYNQVRLGNVHPVRLWSIRYGINTKARVIGTNFNPFSGKVELINKEVTSESTS